MAGDLSPSREAAERVGVSPATLRRWADSGVIPEVDGGRDVDRGRRRARPDRRAAARRAGTRSSSIREAGQPGPARLRLHRVAVRPGPAAERTLDDAAERDRARAGADRALLERHRAGAGRRWRRSRDEDLEALRYVASVLDSGFPLVAFLQLCRVYGQALSQIADAEVRLFHLYVHEPLMREGVPGLQMAEEMEGLARDLLPLASPLMDYVHRRFLQHFVEQDVVGHMEDELEDERHRERARAGGDRVRRPGRLHALHRGGGRGGGALVGRALRRGRDATRCPTTRAW